MTRLMRLVRTLGSILVLGVCVAGCSAVDDDTSERNDNGEVTAAGSVDVYKVRVGDCLPSSVVAGSPSASPGPAITSFPVVPCSDEHGGEVVLVDLDHFKGYDSLPPDEELQILATTTCGTAMEKYTGITVDDLMAAEDGKPTTGELFVPMAFTPQADAWADGDRGLVCVAVSVDANLEDEARSGSAKVGTPAASTGS